MKAGTLKTRDPEEPRFQMRAETVMDKTEWVSALVSFDTVSTFANFAFFFFLFGGTLLDVGRSFSSFGLAVVCRVRLVRARPSHMAL